MSTDDYVAGIDASGNQEIGNYKFISIIIASRSFIDKTMESIGYYEKLTRRTRQKRLKRHIIPRLNFRDNQCRVFCLRVDKDPIIREISNMPQIRRKKVPKQRILKTYDMILLHKIQESILIFLNGHNKRLSEIPFQCDSDCRDFLKHNGLRRVYKGYAHV